MLDTSAPMAMYWMPVDASLSRTAASSCEPKPCLREVGAMDSVWSSAIRSPLFHELHPIPNVTKAYPTRSPPRSATNTKASGSSSHRAYLAHRQRQDSSGERG